MAFRIMELNHKQDRFGSHNGDYEEYCLQGFNASRNNNLQDMH